MKRLGASICIWKEVSCGIRIERLLGTSSLIKREQNAVMNLNCLESPDMSTSNFTKRKSLDKRKIPESIRRPTHAPNDSCKLQHRHHFSYTVAYRVLFGIYFNLIDKLQHSQLLNVGQISHSRRMAQLMLQQSAHSVPNMV